MDLELFFREETTAKRPFIWLAALATLGARGA